MGKRKTNKGCKKPQTQAAVAQAAAAQAAAAGPGHETGPATTMARHHDPDDGLGSGTSHLRGHGCTGEKRDGHRVARPRISFEDEAWYLVS